MRCQRRHRRNQRQSCRSLQSRRPCHGSRQGPTRRRRQRRHRHPRLQTRRRNKPDSEVCATLRAHDAATTSYAQLLQRLPPRLGILAEAAYEVRTPRQRSVGGAAALAAAHPGVMTTLELADVFEDFDATFRRLLRFLSVPEADVGACLAAISSLDVSSCAATPARCLRPAS